LPGWLDRVRYITTGYTIKGGETDLAPANGCNNCPLSRRMICAGFSRNFAGRMNSMRVGAGRRRSRTNIRHIEIGGAVLVALVEPQERLRASNAFVSKKS